MSAEPLVVAARRTPIATRGRALAGVPVDGLAAVVIRAVVADAAAALGSAPPIADVLLGNCMGPGGNPARIAALAAGLGVAVPGGTVDRQCGSGLAAVIDAATAIRSGAAGARIAGGAESASTAPVRTLGGVPYARAPFAPAGWPDPDMLPAADDLARRDGISRTRQEEHARRSHRRAVAAREAGRLVAELVPVGSTGIAADDAIGAALALLPRLPPLLPGGTVTAGTATRVSDGAAAVALVQRDRAPGVAGLVVRGHAVVGCEPALPGIGAAPAVLAALADAGVGIGDVAAFEIVEAFAAQSLAVLDRLGIADDDPRVCADGGALALGHPWGASGAVSMVRLFSRLVRGGAPAGAVGVAAASVGGGMGIAAVVEVVR
ncbi:acetyl-CoA C-acyltransferase [Clavibacter sp. Sh2088]|uniref:acetyl-CoA C-acyltransferase n=1 Tax=Clavibacter sp. Sh2088 TaxID=3397676 RepID=UPI0039DF57AF